MSFATSNMGVGGVLLLCLSLFASTIATDTTQMKIPWPTQHGMIIDAGSTGSRMHVYEWHSRRFNQVPPPFSYPLTSNQWTDRLAPGISSFADNPGDVGSSLTILLEFARETLKGKEHQFHSFPIFLKATGGMRQLATSKREGIIAEVRKFLNNKTVCPFYFENDFARVISGEEEGIYGWTAINFVLGKLLPAQAGTGTVDAKSSVGALDLGGASTQISFFVPNQDILANMFKLQIGGQKHWNVYVHSFLYFGVNSAQERLHGALAEEADSAGKNIAATPCLPDGYEEDMKINGKKITMKGAPSRNIEKCTSHTLPLLRKDLNEWCNFAHNGQCSFAGVYQPDLPPMNSPFGDFYGFGGFKDLWKFLDMPNDRATVGELRDRADYICSLDWQQLQAFNQGHRKKKRESSTPLLAHYCFVASYTYSLLHDGYGFELGRNITAVNRINNLKVGWALGAMLYEINALPWEYVEPSTWVNAFIGSFLLNLIFLILLVFFVHKTHKSAAAIIMSRKRMTPGGGSLATSPASRRSRNVSYAALLENEYSGASRSKTPPGPTSENDKLIQAEQGQSRSYNGGESRSADGEGRTR